MPLAQLLFHLIQNIFFIIAGLTGIGFLIGWHELGHFLFCKLFSISTPSFSIGMGPRIFSKKIGATEFALSAIPLGGYVEIAGAAEVGQGEQNEARRSDEHSFAHKPYYQKLLVMLGGILFNIIFCYIILTGLYFTGMPKSPLLYPYSATLTIQHIEEGSPAQNYLLESGDTILAIDKKSLANPEELIEIIKNKAYQIITLKIDRKGIIQEKKITLGEKKINESSYGYLGIDFIIPQFSLLGAIKMGIQSTHYLMIKIMKSFKNIFSRKALDNLGGPLMVISQTVKGAERGLTFFLLLLAFISINLAVLNLIPLPIMDGGQIVFYTIEAIAGRPLPEKIKMLIHYVCWIGVLILAIILSVKDIMRIIFT
jgi:regulator of sigma E protease